MTKRSRNILNVLLAIFLVLGAVVGSTRAAVQAQQTTYDYSWLQGVAAKPNSQAIEEINQAWSSRSGDQWRSGQVGSGTFDIPGNAVVIGSMITGNNPAFESMGTNIWYTSSGGRFGTSEGFRSFQLDGSVVAPPTARPTTVTAMLALVAQQSEYGRKITVLDVEWSSSPSVINRWGTSAWREQLTATQQDMLKNNGQRPYPVMQLLPGNTIVWGELCANPDPLWGLRKVSENIYVTTGLGGTFCTDRGFRAMQFSAP